MDTPLLFVVVVGLFSVSTFAFCKILIKTSSVCKRRPSSFRRKKICRTPALHSELGPVPLNINLMNLGSRICSIIDEACIAVKLLREEDDVHVLLIGLVGKVESEITYFRKEYRTQPGEGRVLNDVFDNAVSKLRDSVRNRRFSNQ